MVVKVILGCKVEPGVKAKFIDRAGTLDVSPNKLLERVIVSYLKSPIIEPKSEKRVVETFEIGNDADLIELVDPGEGGSWRIPRGVLLQLVEKAVTAYEEKRREKVKEEVPKEEGKKPKKKTWREEFDEAFGGW